MMQLATGKRKKRGQREREGFRPQLKADSCDIIGMYSRQPHTGRLMGDSVA